MNPLSLADFEDYFRELHGHDRPPYDWQSRLAGQVVAGNWPGAIDLPTGSGKTACLDIAVFSLACQASWAKADRTAARRIFFCVNRRVIVDEAARRGKKIADEVWRAERDADGTKPTLRRVAHALRTISSRADPNGPPLDVLELRGGIYRDNRWARSATQPMIVCTTIDQLGSRLLFRGYGVSPNAAPVQASLIAYDSLVLLDEAHISRPFLQTLDSVKRYLDPARWAEQPPGVPPMVVVPMTATPPEGVGDTDIIRIDPVEDRKNLGLDNRLKAMKRVKLLPVSDIVEGAATEANSLAVGRHVAVGVIVNRVAKAKEIYERLRAAHPDAVVELVIGSMRPIDRDRQAERLRTLVGPDRPEVTTATCFVVATQCLEVGADYDFDALVTECASVDALRQRFGRLNRGGRDLTATGAILIDNEQVKAELKWDDDAQWDAAKPLDPIYGNALARTWNWLTERADVTTTGAGGDVRTPRRSRSATPPVVEVRSIDFGIDAFQPLFDSLGGDDRRKLTAPSASLDAPVMLPAYVDCWCQTSPRPTPDPEVALFIHGPQSGEPDVQVCWRADLVEDDLLKRTDWCDIVGLLSPTSAECMSVPISRVRRWLTDESEIPDQGDLLGTADAAPAVGQVGRSRNKAVKRLVPSRAGVLWRGSRERESKVIESPDELRPGDTLVLPTLAGGWDDLGHVPPSAPIDVAETAFRSARDRAVLRLHPSLREQLPDSDAITELLGRLGDPEGPLTQAELRQLLSDAADGFGPEQPRTCRDLANRCLGLVRENYPDDRGVVLSTRRRLGSTTDWYLPVVDEGEDDRSQTTCRKPIGLDDHTRHVWEEVIRTATALPLDELSGPYGEAADLHDLGKADERFQAMLRRTDRTDTWLLAGTGSALLAKSDGMPQTPQQRREARERAGLPEGFRHEMLSVQIADRFQLVAAAHRHRDLILHLIAAHHGYARPFAPLVLDGDPPDVTVKGVALVGAVRLECPPHRLDSRIAERFWSLTRRYGWWGLAYLEAILRLADQQASADEDAGVFGDDSVEAEPVGAGT
jgi:CRISPR-associated endonuclease/helicase Cas3